jgi:hypothetical protein
LMFGRRWGIRSECTRRSRTVRGNVPPANALYAPTMGAASMLLRNDGQRQKERRGQKAKQLSH